MISLLCVVVVPVSAAAVVGEDLYAGRDDAPGPHDWLAVVGSRREARVVVELRGSAGVVGESGEGAIGPAAIKALSVRPTQHILGGHVARVAVVNLGSGELLCRVIGDPVALREPLGRIEPLPRVGYLGRLDP